MLLLSNCTAFKKSQHFQGEWGGEPLPWGLVFIGIKPVPKYPLKWWVCSEISGSLHNICV